jgi:hypothetical protein
VQEAEARIATAKKQATAISERTQQEFAWRKQQLRRETELLHQRKQAVLSQLASLSALAEQTASAFPDLDDPSDLDSDPTILRESDGPASKAAAANDRTAEAPAEDAPTENTPDAKPAKPAPQQEAEPEVDGDATVLVSPSELPAGTEHLTSQNAKSN